MSKGKESIKHKIDTMKNAVLVESGVSLEALRGNRGQGIRPRGSRGLGKFPPRPIMGGPQGPMFGPRGGMRPSMRPFAGSRPNAPPIRVS